MNGVWPHDLWAVGGVLCLLAALLMAVWPARGGRRKR